MISFSKINAEIFILFGLERILKTCLTWIDTEIIDRVTSAISNFNRYSTPPTAATEV